LAEYVERYNRPVAPDIFDEEFSWRKHVADVEADVATAWSAKAK